MKAELPSQYVVRRGWRGRVPVTAISLSLALIGIAWWSGEPGAASYWAAITMPAVAAIWSIALWRRKTPLAVLRPDEIEHGGVRIPWAQVERCELQDLHLPGSAILRLRLRTPLAADTLIARINSLLSRRESDFEIVIPLPGDRASVVHVGRLAHGYWSTANQGDSFYEPVSNPPEYQDPPRLKRIVVFAVVSGAFLLAAAHGMVADFLVSDTWSPLSWLLALLAVVLGMYRLLRNHGLRSLRNQQSTSAYGAALLLVVAMMTAVCWFAVGRSLPDLYTRGLGTAVSFTVELRKEPDPRHCTERLVGEWLANRFPSSYCASPEEFAALPTSGGMRVIARQSWFGIHIDAIEPDGGKRLE